MDLPGHWASVRRPLTNSVGAISWASKSNGLSVVTKLTVSEAHVCIFPHGYFYSQGIKALNPKNKAIISKY